MCHLHRLALATIVDTPYVIQSRASYAITGSPELICDTGIGGIPDHVLQSSSPDLPCDLTAKLEVQASVVDGPALDAIHIETVVDASDQLLEGQVTWFQVDTHHANDGRTRETICSHRSHGFLSDNGRRGSRIEVVLEDSVPHQMYSAALHPLIVVNKPPQGVGDRTIGRQIDDVRSIAEIAFLVESQE